jgi:phosphoribosylglycinamide formyltransferase-1
LLQALLDACALRQVDAAVVAVGSDVPDCAALGRARAVSVPAFNCSPTDYSSRDEWNDALVEIVQALSPDWVISAGFMRVLGPGFVDAFPGRIINTHPALLPAFPGAHAVRDALAAGVKVTGCTVHVVDHGIDTGPILAQRAVVVRDDDDEESLHERIKAEERQLLVETVSTLIGESA